ncbi:MAG: hypothetical protein Q8P02_02805, partial [Candidatus Micrarchaeota archaeon]|nr:hypothetical protein [Candidatus Micrarchaeota archaeon]
KGGFCIRKGALGRPEMKHSLKPSRLFLKQVRELNEQERRLVAEKLELAKLNPFRYKALHGPGLTKVFEIKATLDGLYSRIIYFLDGPEIKIAGIINRKNEFKDLMRLLYEARREKPDRDGAKPGDKIG